MSDTPRHFVLAMTGASGSIYGLRLLECLLKSGHAVDLVVSATAGQVLRHEMNLAYNFKSAANALAPALGGADTSRLHAYEETNYFCPPASGSAQRDGVIVCPCSMGSVGRFANGVGKGLIERAVAVALKERRRLILVPRETPLSAIDLDNLARLAHLGATVLPAMPGFYQHPKQINDMVDFVVARILNSLGLPQDLLPPWQG